MIGQKFGRLLVLSQFRESTKRYMCNVRCDCGTEKAVLRQNIKRGFVISCGCRWEETKKRTKGYSVNCSTYQTWENMHSRCRVHTKQHANSFAFYDGIVVCEKWSGPEGYKNFLADMGEKPDSEYHAIDRIDGTLGYFPENCRWVTRKEQQRNLRTNRWIDVDGDRRLVSDWHKFLGFRCNWINHLEKKIGRIESEKVLIQEVQERKKNGTDRRMGE